MRRWLKKLTSVGTDKYIHVIACALFVGILGHILNIILAVLITLLIAISKELIYDKMLKKGTADIKDIFADIIGILIGIL